MKREKFLWPITHAHHFGLMAAKDIQRKLSEKPGRKKLEELRKKAVKFLKNDLAEHIGVEERVLEQLALHVGKADPLLEKARREHRELGQLLKKKGARALELFADKLIMHIYFEEDKLFPEIEDQFTQAEKEWVETDIQFNIHDWPRIPAFQGK
ncbi:MAG TPA: hemerythrin domain-containing protein [bacterium]|nr:hemerythrin domain-containing protein [bacterium]